MALGTVNILATIESHLKARGHFTKVNMHEPKIAPGKARDFTAAVWLNSIVPAPRIGGLSATGARVEYTIRIYQQFLAEPLDAIDPMMAMIVDDLFEVLSGDFELGGNVMCIDLLGLAGLPLRAEAGYLEQDRVTFRVMDINVPLLINNAWSQSG
jgi:hypothetical protein